MAVWDACGVNTAREVSWGVVQQARTKQGCLSSNQLGAGAPRAYAASWAGVAQVDGAAVGGHWVRAVTLAWTLVVEVVATSVLYFHLLLEMWMPASTEGS